MGASGGSLETAVLAAALAIGFALGFPLARLAQQLLHTPRPLGWRALLGAAATTAALFVLLAAVIGARAALPAYLLFACASIVLGIVDLSEKRLPNVLTLPAAAAVVVALALATAVTGAWQPFVAALLGGCALFAVYLLLALISPSGMGMGDVKLALVVGVALGYLGWNTWLIGLLAAFLVGALVSLLALALGRATRTSRIPFGPSMLAGTYLAMLITN